MSLQDDIKRLNSGQKAIIKNLGKNSLVIAGPGTGKTRTISVLIGDLLRKGHKLKDILALTFSDKAAEELKSRVLEYYPYSFDQCWISTFHSFCARILRSEYYLVGIKPDFKLLTSFKEALLMSEICKRQDKKAFKQFGRVIDKRGFQREALSFITMLKSNLVGPTGLEMAVKSLNNISPRSKERLSELLSLFKLYENELKKCGYLDFRDLISLSVEVFKNPEAAKRYRQRFKFILVDEFQDTDPAQFLLLSLLKGNDENIKTAVIGDPKQSIYRFRGANPAIIAPNGLFKKKYNAKVFALNTNYRSSKAVVAAANKLKWQSKAEVNTKIEAFSQNEGFARLYKASDELEEARIITRKIASLLIYGEERKYKPNEIAVLVRNNYQIDTITECLEALHIKYAIAGNMKFFRSEEVIALASLLKAALQPEANQTEAKRTEALRRAFASPIFEIKQSVVQAIIAGLTANSSIESFFDAISEESLKKLTEADEETINKIRTFEETVKRLISSAEKSIPEVFEILISPITQKLENLFSNEAKNIMLFKNMLADYCEVFAAENSKQPNLKCLMPEFEEWLNYYASTLEQNNEANEDGVKIMTVHQSKGLEFPVVFVCGLSETVFPAALRENILLETKTIEALKSFFDNDKTRQADFLQQVDFFNPNLLNQKEQLEEERRLFYVALTRAKEGIIFSYPAHCGTDPVMKAPFLSELELRAIETGADERPLTPAEIRTKLSALSEEELKSIKPELEQCEKVIPHEISVHGLWPRQFSQPKIDKVVLDDNFVFSASSIQAYADCPRRFFFKHVLAIRNRFDKFNDNLIAGNIWHACLKKLHTLNSAWEAGKTPNEADIEKIIDDIENYDFKNEFALLDFFKKRLVLAELKEGLPRYAAAIFNNEQLPPRNTIGVEYPFETRIHNRRFKGRFDRLVNMGGNSVLVVDYKTTSKMLSSDKLFDKAFSSGTGGVNLSQEIQIPLYMAVCRQLGYKNVSAALLYVKEKPYGKNYKEMKKGDLHLAALNLGDTGLKYGKPAAENDLSGFLDNLKVILDKIYNDKTFDCCPSSGDDAYSCKKWFNNKPKCEFLPFCQERLEQLKIQIEGGAE